MFRVLFLPALAILLLPLHAFANDFAKAGPKFTDSVAIVESQPVKNGRLVYWDQSVADALGLKTPPGRVGLERFEQEVLRLIGWEIKQGAKSLPLTSERRQGNRPNLFIEMDAHKGSGRAGYIEAQPDVWVNIKGIGLTGQGNAKGSISPPSEKFLSHADGSATLEEAIKEAIMSRVADAELKRGAGRVLAVVYTGRTIRYDDGRKVPLATIVRVPTRRYDREQRPVQVIRTMAEANSRRFLKGDFVNRSNLGAYGEIVDFGCMTHTCGYAHVRSSQEEIFLSESLRMFSNNPNAASLMDRELGKNLLNQMGTPEPMLEKVASANPAFIERYQSIGETFKKLVSFGDSGPTLIDFEAIDPSRLKGVLPWHEYFREAAADWLLQASRTAAPIDRIVAADVTRLRNMPGFPDHPDFLPLLRKFISESATAAIDSARAHSPLDLERISAGVREVARFKNRDVPALLRPNLFREIGTVSDRFVADRNAEEISRYIENTVLGNRYSTTPASDAGTIARATPDATELFFRAEVRKDRTGLFAYPELSGAGPGETFGFRVSADGWATFQDLDATVMRTPVGDYFKIILPNATTPFTWKEVEAAPFVRQSVGGKRWLREGLNIRGPPLVFNERFGLPANFTRVPSGLLPRYGVRTAILPDDLNGPSRPWRPAELSQLLDELLDPIPDVQLESSKEITSRWDEFVESLKSSPALQKRFAEVVEDKRTSLKPLLEIYKSSATQRLPSHPQTAIRSVLLDQIKRSWDNGHLAEALFGDIYGSLSPAERRPFLRELLSEISRSPDSAGLIRVLSNPKFLALPDSDIAISGLIKRRPKLKELMDNVLSAEIVGPDRGARLLKKLVSRPEFNPEVDRVFRNWKMTSQQAADLADLIVRTDNAQAHLNLLKGWVSSQTPDDRLLELVDRIVEKGLADQEIARSIFTREEYASKPQSIRWARKILDRGKHVPETLQTVSSTRWDLLHEERMKLLQDLSASGKWNAQIVSSFSGAQGKFLEDARSSQILIPLFKEHENEALRLMSREQFARTAAGTHFARTITSPEWIARASAGQKEDAISALIYGFARHPDGIELMREALKQLNPAKPENVSALFDQPDWIHHPRLGDLIADLKRRDLIGARASLKMTHLHDWQNHPYQAELVEYLIRKGELRDELHMAGLNPVLAAVCKSNRANLSCLKEAFDRGLTTANPWDSKDLEIRKAAAKLMENYFENKTVVRLDAPYTEAYRRYRARCLADSLKSSL